MGLVNGLSYAEVAASRINSRIFYQSRKREELVTSKEPTETGTQPILKPDHLNSLSSSFDSLPLSCPNTFPIISRSAFPIFPGVERSRLGKSEKV